MENAALHSGMHFGRRLRLLREEAEMSGRALAIRAGVSPSTVRYVETGEHAPRLDVAERLAGALGLTIGQLLDGPDGSVDR